MLDTHFYDSINSRCFLSKTFSYHTIGALKITFSGLEDNIAIRINADPGLITGLPRSLAIPLGSSSMIGGDPGDPLHCSGGPGGPWHYGP